MMQAHYLMLLQRRQTLDAGAGIKINNTKQIDAGAGIKINNTKQIQQLH